MESPWPPQTSADFPRLASLPAYVFAQVNAEKMVKIAAGEDIIDLGMGNPDIGAPPHIVDELVAHAADHKHHRYSASRGIYGLRDAMAEHYARRYGVQIDSESEVVVTIGAKEGIAHLMLAILDAGDTVIVPAPAYPIHSYSVVFAGGRVHAIPLAEGEPGMVDGDALLRAVEEACASTWPRPKALILSFPNNPTTLSADAGFMERAVEVCRREQLLLVHDFAYADFSFSDDEPPSLMQVPGARDIGVEFFSMSKSYGMAGWRVGFCVGNPAMVGALVGDLPVRNLAFGAAVLAFSLAGIFGIGFAFAGLVLRTGETAQTLATVLQFAFMVVCAPFFPFGVLPEWARAVSRAIPTAHAVDLFRSTLMGFPPGFPELASPAVGTAVVFGSGVLLPVFGFWFYRRSEEWARRRGSLSEY